MTISCHGHGELRLALANFLSAVEAGAANWNASLTGLENALVMLHRKNVIALYVRKFFNNK